MAKYWLLKKTKVWANMQYLNEKVYLCSQISLILWKIKRNRKEKSCILKLEAGICITVAYQGYLMIFRRVI